MFSPRQIVIYRLFFDLKNGIKIFGFLVILVHYWQPQFQLHIFFYIFPKMNILCFLFWYL